MGNVANLPYQPVERTGAALLATPQRLLQGRNADPNLPTLREAGAMWKTYVPGQGNWKAAGRAAFSGPSPRLQAAMGAPTAPATRLERVNALGYHALGVFDRFARSLAEAAERNAQTARGAGQADIDARAAAAGDYRTLTQDLDDIGRRIDGLRGLPGGELVVPYWQIPYNGMKYDLERSPLGLASAGKGVAEYRAGRIDATEMYERWSRALLGTGVAWALYQHALAGNITGPDPSSQTERDAWRAEGKVPFALRVGTRWVPMSQIPGVNAPLIQASAVADFVRRHGEEGRSWDAEEYQRLANRAVTATIHAVATRPFFDGISNLLEAADQSDETGQRGLLPDRREDRRRLPRPRRRAGHRAGHRRREPGAPHHRGGRPRQRPRPVRPGARAPGRVRQRLAPHGRRLGALRQPHAGQRGHRRPRPAPLPRLPQRPGGHHHPAGAGRGGEGRAPPASGGSPCPRRSAPRPASGRWRRATPTPRRPRSTSAGRRAGRTSGGARSAWAPSGPRPASPRWSRGGARWPSPPACSAGGPPSSGTPPGTGCPPT